jgi:hypothetical protein
MARAVYPRISARIRLFGYMLGLCAVLVAPLTVRATPSFTAPQQAITGWNRLYIPFSTTGSTQRPSEQPALEVALNTTDEVQVGGRVRVTLTVRNTGKARSAGATLTLPYDGSKYRLVGTDLTNSDWLSENRFPLQVKLQFGAIAPDETRHAVLWMQLQPQVNGGDTLQFVAQATTDACATGGTFCQTNLHTVRVTTNPPNNSVKTSFGIGSFVPGEQIMVTAVGLAPLEPVTVWLQLSNGAASRLALNDQSDAFGQYAFAVASNNYPLGWSSIVVRGNYSRQLWVGRFELRNSTTTQQIKTASLLHPTNRLASNAEHTATTHSTLAQTNGSVAGVVSTAVGTSRLAGVLVTLTNPTNQTIGQTITDVFGGYRIAGLPTGTYTITFDPQGSFSPDVRLMTPQTSLIAINAPNETIQNVALTSGRVVRGNVSAAVGGAALTDVSVILMNGTTVVGSDTTDTTGAYALTGLSAGTYTLMFEPRDSSNTATIAYVPFTRTVTVANSDLNESVSLERNLLVGQIAGRVTTSDSGRSLAGALISVSVRRPTASAFEFVTLTETDQNGNYLTPPLPWVGVEGEYRVQSLPGIVANALNNRYLDTFFTLDGINPASIAINGGQVRGNVNMITPLGARILGRVIAIDKGPNGADLPLRDVFVIAYDTRNTPSEADDLPVGFGISDASGVYTTTAVTSGFYRLTYSSLFARSVPTINYQSTTLFDLVTIIGVDRGGVNATLRRGGSISGTVRASDSEAPLPGVVVAAINDRNTPSSSDDEVVSTAITDSTGNYRINSLPSGAYKIRFSSEQGNSNTRAYFTRFYNGKSTIELADRVTVNADSANLAQRNISDISTALVRGAQIRGVLQGSDTFGGLTGVLVKVFNANDQVVSMVVSDSDGSYATTGLPPGAYRLKFEPQLSSQLAAYQPEFYNDQLTLAAATSLTLSTSETRLNINAVLAR